MSKRPRRPDNKAVINGDTTEILIYNVDGTEACRVLVDTEDYVSKLRFGKWRDKRRSNGEIDTIVGTYGRLGRCIMEGKIPEGYEVDHINRDVLDNRKSNLRVISKSDNLKNRIQSNKVGEPYIQKDSKGYVVKVPIYSIDSLDLAKSIRDAMVKARSEVLRDHGIEDYTPQELL